MEYDKLLTGDIVNLCVGIKAIKILHKMNNDMYDMPNHFSNIINIIIIIYLYQAHDPQLT